MIKKKVFGGVPYAIIEPGDTWNPNYYSNLLDEDGFHSWYENTIADNTCIYEIYNVLTIPTDEGNGFSIAIRVLKPQPDPGPLAVVVDGPEVSTKPLDFIDMTCEFANNEESILSYELNAWRTTTSVIYTTPPERYPIREGSGYNSAIMGHYRNQADGDYSVAEGLDTNASGERSHAEGCSTEASGLGSHAEGYDTRAIGDYSHTEGSGTTANNDYEHAEGIYNKSNTGKTDDLKTRHSIGIGNLRFDTVGVDRKNAHEIMANGDHYVFGLGGYDGTNATADTTQTLQEVINSKQATITPGTGLEFEGNTLNVTLDTTVFKVVSVLPDSPAQGDENKIHLVPAESTGANNAYTEYVWVNSAWEILGEYTSEVDLTPYLKTADAANTYLSKTDAASTYLSKTDASSTYLNKTNAVGKIDSTSDGTGEIFNSYTGSAANVASGYCSHAEGESAHATGWASHAECYVTYATGQFSHAEGSRTTAEGDASHAEGSNTKATGVRSHAEGSNSEAIGINSHAEGSNSEAIGDNSHAEGAGSEAIGINSHAEGWITTASGKYSHAEGSYTQTFSSGEHAEGSYNKSYESTDNSVRVRHSVGIGSQENDRKNAHEIKFNGDHYIYGIGGFDGTNSASAQTLQEVIQSLLGITIDMNQTTTGYTNGDQYYKIYDLSSLNYVPGCAIILQSENSSNNSIRFKFIYAYDESGLAETIQFTESDSMTYDSFTLLSPLITNMGVDQLTVFHGKINSENEFKYYLVIQTTVDPEPTNS